MKTTRFDNRVNVYHIDLEYDAEVYRDARNGQVWINCAVDRCRFNNRINACKDVLQSVLTKEHRQCVLKSIEQNMLKGSQQYVMQI